MAESSMFRIKYLLAILSGIFALLYLFFGVVGWSYALDIMDKSMAFILFGVHALIAVVLFRSSYNDHKIESQKLDILIPELLETNISLTPAVLAASAEMTVAEAHEYIERCASRHDIVIAKSSDGKTLRAFPAYTLN